MGPTRPARFPAKILNVAATIGLLALACTTRAAEVQPSWRLDFERPIGWQRATTLGDLIVNTAGGLYAVEPETGNVRWSHTDLGSLPRGGFEELPGAPLVVIDDGREDPRTVILNLMTGALVFDSQAENLTQIASKHILPHSGSLLIAGFETGKPQPTLFLYDINSGKRLWSSDALNEGMNNLMRFLVTAALVLTDSTPMQSAPVELNDGTFIVGAMGNVYRFDQSNGQVIWKTAYAGGAFELQRSARNPDVVYVGAEETNENYVTTQYQGFRLSDGEPAWKRPFRFSKPMNPLTIPIDRGLLVSEGDRDKGRLRLLEYDTGESLWGRRGRGIELKGQILDYVYTDAGLVLTTGFDSIWTDKGTEYLLYVLDTQTGAMRFEDPVKVRGRLLTTELTDKGLLYVTSHEINVFDPASGTLLNEPVLRSREQLVTVNDGQLLYAFNSDDGYLYRLDRNTGRVSRLSTEAFRFQEKDQPRGLDVLDNNLVLMGQQTVARFNLNGELQAHAHYRAPRNPNWLRALAWAEGIRAGMASAYAGLYSTAAMAAAAEAEEGSVGQQIAEEFQTGFSELQQGYAGLSQDYIAFARKRYQASAQSRDFVFMMVQDDQRNISLSQVSKLDGRILGQIDMRSDKEPDYQVDGVANQIFYRPADSVITAYRFSNGENTATTASR